MLQSCPLCSLAEYGALWFRSYVDLVREYSVFFNPTLRSPMPRSRGEAMLSGLATVNAKNHDVERFIESCVDPSNNLDPAGGPGRAGAAGGCGHETG